MAIRVGIGGWNYAPWRGAFYPAGLAQRLELEYASRQVTAIEINATYYRTQKPESFARWRDETPDGFVFALKANRFATNRRVLGEAGESIGWFVSSGITELGDKLGPIVWQFAPTKRFDEGDFGDFLKLLPQQQDGIALRHVLEVRHESFRTPEFVAMCRAKGAAIVFADSPEYPAIADITGDFVYARLQTGSDDVPTCYTPKALGEWAGRARTWAEGKAPDDLPRADPASDAPVKPRDVFVYFITSGKVRAPHGAMAFMERV